MKPLELKNFEEFESKATVLWRNRQGKRKEKGEAFSPVLFRGQERASWPLTTSLERYSNRQYSPKDYYNVMRSVRPVVESCTGTRWKFCEKYTRNDSSSIRPPRPPQEYEFMVYLRHHGFPSPLLDWTCSFYVAAFFAFRSAKVEEPGVAIYAFTEHGDRGKCWGNEAHIVGCGPSITTPKRHVIQQTQFTFCEKREGEQYLYCSHEEAFNRNDENQDILTKFVIPKTERTKVLDRLGLMNITAYSLFGDEESLLATEAYEKIEGREARRGCGEL